VNKAICLLICIFLTKPLLSQYNQQARNAFMQQDIQQAFDYWNIQRPNQTFHSSFRPYLSSSYSDATDSLVPFKFYAFKNYFLSKTLNEKPEKRNWYNLQIHPIIDASVGYDNIAQRIIPELAGGLHVKTNINDDFTFALTAVGGRLTNPFFIDTTFAKKFVSPEYGMVYGNNKKGYSFFDYTGYISYSPHNNKIFNLQVGRDKHFIGDGYRSVLLSDYAPAYPYFRINTNIWHIQYNVWYTWMYDIESSAGLKNNFKNKFGTFHYLSYNILKELNVGLFENIVWRGTDTNQVRTFDANYLNPVIFFRPQEYAIGSPDNAFLGLNINAKLFKTLKLYGQLGLDEFYLKEIRLHRGWWANKQAWQLGAKYINAFRVKGLSVQAEYNEVRPYTYSHGLVEQNYAHYGMPLAHPLGANFREFLGFITYRKKSWQFSLQGMYAIVGKDSANGHGNIGQNIFLSYVTRSYEYGNRTTQGIKTNLLQSQLMFTYFIIPDMNLRLELSYIQRAENNSQGYALQNPYVFLALRSSFWNSYKDY
jgi:hypothetical protein